MLQPFDVAAQIREDYRRYVRTAFPLRDPELERQRDGLIDEHGLLWSEPYVSLSRPGTTGPELSDLGGELDPRTLALPWGFERLYAHQATAIDRLRTSRPGGPASTLILSGTGSGKTEAFLIPIVDACLRDPRPGVQAVLIYPMNALANDQLGRLRDLLDGTEVTFGRYTGDAPERDEGSRRQAPRPADAPPNLLWSREAMRATPPNILITNYLQLELLLLRGRDRELFAHGAPRYLVVDEIHLFGGVLGAEVAALLRRFRQHVGAAPGDITVVGTSATAGSDAERTALRGFAQRFFGVALDPDALVEEQPAPAVSAGGEIPAPPTLDDDILRAATDTAGLNALARACLGLELDGVGEDELRDELGEELDRFRAIGVLDEALTTPASVSEAAHRLAALRERRDSDREALRREAEALILLGSAATRPVVGEPAGAPRLRPRVHQIVRSLTGLARCLGCRRLLPPGAERCATCGSRALALASCRSCGEAYWSAPIGPERTLLPSEAEPGEPRRFLGAGDLGTGDDESGSAHRWDEIVVCAGCGAWTEDPAVGLAHSVTCPTPTSSGSPLRSSEDGRYCPSCGASGVAGRDILTPQRGAGAASVAVLTQLLGDELRAREGDAGGRLLVFADSRQDAGQQAGYADDQGARIAVRQLVVEALAAEAGGLSFPALWRRVAGAVTDDRPQLRRWLVGEAREQFVERAAPEFVPSGEDRTSLARQIEWETVLELSERARRRYSLEGQGLLVVDLDPLAEIVAGVHRRWPDHPFVSNERLGEVLLAVADAMRFARAVSQRWLRLTPDALRRNHDIRIGDRAVNATTGFADRAARSRRDGIDIRAWFSPRGDVRIAKLVGRVIGEPARSDTTRETVARLIGAMRASGLLVDAEAAGRPRTMVGEDHLLARPADRQLYRCPRCGHVRGHMLTAVDGSPLCLGHNCKGRPEPWSPVETRDFYRAQYRSAPRRLVVREHSGQIENDVRLALERSFNQAEPVTVDVLACTPTLEVGVSLDDLNAVVLRNLPPTPANYAQRVGRAGRRSKVALAVAHAGNSPHDAYYFERPGELIAGAVRAPAISLDNEPLLRRHLRSLILSTLGLPLPQAWMPPRDGDGDQDSVADDEGVLRESVIEPFREALATEATRRGVEEAVRGAFASSLDPDPPPGIDAVGAAVIAAFPDDLRRALMRWCDRYRAIDAERAAIAKVRRPSQDERRERDRLELELDRLERPTSPDFLPLGFLGLVGFLPKYGATGERSLLSVPRSEAPIDQAAHVAVTEYAPGNLVYARGRRLKVTRLYPRPVPDVEATEFRDNVIKHGRRCDRCGTFSTDPLVHACPSCGDDLLDQEVVRLTGVRGSGAAISSEDEYRTRAAYAVAHYLGSEPEHAQGHSAGGLTFRLSRRREITVANRGLRPDGDMEEPRGFAVCTECGFTEEDEPDREEADGDDVEEHRGHASTCPARRDPRSDVVLRGTWLIAQLRGDVLEIPLEHGQDSPGLLRWRRTLPEALMLGIRETMQAGRRDLESFELSPQGAARAIVVYDTMPGGTGYLPKLLTGGGLGLRGAATTALERLERCDCETSCHRCLRDFWNQRDHRVLDRHAVIPTLRRLAEEPGVDRDVEPDERLASFLEREFFSRLQDSGIPTPTLQAIHRLPDGRITVADAAYADPDISIYLDGRAYHALSRDRIAADLHRRNQLEAESRLVLEFTYGDVMDDFEGVANCLREALAAEGTTPPPDPPNELTVLEHDPASRTLAVEVDADSWIRSEDARRADLHAANAARLGGWRLQRITRNGPDGPTDRDPAASRADG